MKRAKLSRKILFLASMLLFLSLTLTASAATRGELVGALYTRLGYSLAQNQILPPDVSPTHNYAEQIGSAVRFGLISRDALGVGEQVTRAEAVRITLQMMGWGFEADLCRSLAQLPDLAGSGDPIFFLASEMKPPAPKYILVDGDTPLSASGMNAILAWADNCKIGVSWNQVYSYGGTDLILFRQGIAKPGEPNPNNLKDNPIGSKLNEPLFVAAIAVTPSAADQHIAFAEPLGRPRATPSEFASCYDAIGIVNGGFFASSRPLGSMLLDGTPVGKPLPGRSAVGWQSGSSPIFGGGEARIGINTASGFIECTRFNAPPEADGISFYSSGVTAAAAGLSMDTLEVIVQGGTVVELRESFASTHETPQGGILIAARGRSRALLENYRPGDAIDVKSSWQTPAFENSVNLIQAGPMLVRNNHFVNGAESFKSDVLNKRHPRTIMGTDGVRSFWVVIDGRSNLRSRGTTIEETRHVAMALGLQSALNMDGGGSSQLMWRGILINSPSDGKERPLPYAIIMTPKGEKLVRRNVIVPSAATAAATVMPPETGEYGEAGEKSDVWMDVYIP